MVSSRAGPETELLMRPVAQVLPLSRENLAKFNASVAYAHTQNVTRKIGGRLRRHCISYLCILSASRLVS